MKLYDETKPLYLATDSSGMGLGAVLLQTRDGATCPRDIAPDNTILKDNYICKQKSDKCRMNIH